MKYREAQDTVVVVQDRSCSRVCSQRAAVGQHGTHIETKDLLCAFLTFQWRAIYDIEYSYIPLLHLTIASQVVSNTVAYVPYDVHGVSLGPGSRPKLRTLT